MNTMYQPFYNSYVDLDEYTRDIIRWHFNPDTGSPFWLNKRADLDFNPIKDILRYEDLGKFGFFDDGELARISMTDLIPKGFAGSHALPIRIFETGGTLGPPKRIIDIEYRKSIVEWFSYCLDLNHFPRDGNWLHLGPAGPHVVGHTTGGLSALRNGLCYYIDIDTRWVKHCVRKAYAAHLEEYFDHVLNQAIDVMETQEISFVFTTPRLISMLAEKKSLESMKGVVLGGTHVTKLFHKVLREEILHDIPLCIVYGNTLMGVAPQPEFRAEDGYDIHHYGLFPDFHIEVVDPDRPDQQVAYGQKGRIKINTLTKELFIPNMLERDEAVRIKGSDMFSWDGVANVSPLGEMKEEIVEGVY